MIGFTNLESIFSGSFTRFGFANLQNQSSQITLGEIFKDIKAIKKDKKLPVSALVTDSRKAVKNCVFFAIEGLNTNGNNHIGQAINLGATTIVSTMAKSPFFPHINWIEVKDVKDALANACSKFYQEPDSKINITGITGTNGKTTTSFISSFILNQAQKKCGLLGTIVYDLGARKLPSYRTTPEAPNIYAFLSQMQFADCKNAIIEVSSHAIDQNRIKNIKIQTAVFLNISQDHIDYHKNMDSYYEVKKSFMLGKCGFTPKNAIINLDDDKAQDLINSITSSNIITFSIKNENATIFANNICLDSKGTSFDLHFQGKKYCLKTNLTGSYNLSNCLASFAIAQINGVNVDDIIESLALFKGVPGRMEKIENNKQIDIFVDYAHTDDALKNALDMLKNIAKNKIYVVFGCGGNRDKEKRPLMTKVAMEKADFCWATSDNPRKEKIEDIFADMKKGVVGENIEFISDRRTAIFEALSKANKGDIILIAGKGHETYQEFADTVIAFDDRLVVKEILDNLSL